MQQLLVEFEKFFSENPLDFDTAEMERVKRDIVEPRNGIVSDEYVDFLLWQRGQKQRYESFAELVKETYPLEKYSKILEVGCGRMAKAAHRLSESGYKMTAMDSQAETDSRDVRCIREIFHWEHTDITEFDAVVGQEPCEATEHIVRACVNHKKNFLIVLCGVPHKLLSGEEPESAFGWYKYLQEIGGKECRLMKLSLVEGYINYVILGEFAEEEDDLEDKIKNKPENTIK